MTTHRRGSRNELALSRRKEIREAYATGRYRTIADVAREFGVSYALAHNCIRNGWRVLNAPVGREVWNNANTVPRDAGESEPHGAEGESDDRN